MIIGIISCPGSKCHSSKFTSTYLSGTDSKNMAVDIFNPICSIPTPADTLNKEGVNAPTSFAKGWSLISSTSFFEKVELFPTNEPRVLTFLLTIR